MRNYSVELLEYAAFTRYRVDVMAGSADEACAKARAEIESDDPADGSFEHWDGNKPFVVAIDEEREDVPAHHGEIAVTFGACASAAPDMLEALRGLLQAFEDPSPRADRAGWMMQARAAIAKAEASNV